MKSILDPSFRYTASFDTDLRRTFARVRLEGRKAAEQGTEVATPYASNVTSIVRNAKLAQP
jgi:hypothetical protein